MSVQRSRSRIQTFAEHLKRNPTPAEREFTQILNTVDGGKLRDTFTCQRRVGRKWILDVFFFRQCLGIEIDGGYHSDPKRYRWTIIPVDRRRNYMAALESASVDQDIKPFTIFLAGLLDHRAANARQVQN